MKNNFQNESFSLLLGNSGELFLKYLFDKYYGELCKLSYRYVGRAEIAEDIVQEVFINIWNKRQEISYEGPVKPYFIRSVINASLNYVQSKYAKIDFEEDSKLVYWGASNEMAIEHKELEDIINKAIEQLPDRCRTIFVMSRMSGFSQKEIADQLGISVKTIEAQMTIALKRMHQSLKKMGYFPLWLFF
jgi:RNA polymerase sigma-70 factor (ECF subfamily)